MPVAYRHDAVADRDGPFAATARKREPIGPHIAAEKKSQIGAKHVISTDCMSLSHHKVRKA